MPLVFGVIPARAGSKGLPGKNLKPLGGVPLIAWTIRAAAESCELARTWVSTEDVEIARVAREHGAEVPFLRPDDLAGDDSSILAVLQHAVREFETQTGSAPDVVVLLQPTTPFRTGGHIDEAVAAVVRDGADSAQTVALDERHPHVRFTLDADGRLRSLFTSPEQASHRQGGVPVYRPNGGVYAARTALVMEQGTLYGRDHRGVVMDFCSSVDIDSPWDMRLAEAILAEGGWPVPPVARDPGPER